MPDMTFLCFLKKTAINKIKIAKLKQQSEIGRLKKIEKLPIDIRRLCRKESSILGPKINAITKGAAS